MGEKCQLKAENVNEVTKRICVSLSLACDPRSAARPVSLPLHAQSSVPPPGEAPRLPQRRKHSCQGEETAQPGRNTNQHPGARRRIPADGQLAVKISNTMCFNIVEHFKYLFSTQITCDTLL